MPDARPSPHVAPSDPAADRAAGDEVASARRLALSRRLAFAEIAVGSVHELNNALQVIGGVVELLDRRTDLPDAVVTKLNRIGLQTDRAAAALSALQELSRATTGRPVGLDLDRLVEEVVALRRYRLDRAGVAVQVRGAAGRARVRADGTLVRHAILILLLNAEQAVESRPAPEIAIDVEVHDETVTLTVRDSGPGVASMIRDRLFEPWVTTRGQDAAGLGLWSARAAAERLGGSLVLCDDDRRGCGATFRLRLPADREPGSAHATECSSSSA
jgi:signal transduction histidine kinase